MGEVTQGKKAAGPTGKKQIHHRRPAWWPQQWPAELIAMGIGAAEARALVGRCVARKQGMFHHFPEYEREDLMQIGLMGILTEYHKYDKKRNWRTFFYKVVWSDIRDTYRGRRRRANTEGKVAVDDPDGAAAVVAWRGGQRDVSNSIHERPEWVEALQRAFKYHPHKYRSIKEITKDGGIVPAARGLKMADYDKLMGRAEAIMKRLSGLVVPKVEVEVEPDITLHLLDSEEGESMVDWLLRIYITCKTVFRGEGLNTRKRGGRHWFSPAQCAAATLLSVRLGMSARELAELFKQREDLRRVIHFLHPPSHMFFVRARGFVPKKFLDYEGLAQQWQARVRRELANKSA